MENPTLNDYRHLLSAYLPDELIIDCYNSILKNDPAHNVTHVYRVCEYGLRISRGEVSNYDISRIMAGCLMHDLGCRYDRKTHHLISYGLAFEKLEKYAADYFDSEDNITIAQSCMEHRASWDGSRSSYISDYVAVADRGPINLYELVYRCIQFRHDSAESDSVLIKDVLTHLQEKCGTDGYMWKTYPGLGFRINQKVIDEVIAMVDNTSELMIMINKTLVDYRTNVRNESK